MFTPLIFATIIMMCGLIIVLDIILAKSTGQRWLLAIIIPSIMIVLGAVLYVTNELKGHPLDQIPDKFVLLAQMEAKPNIYMWVIRDGDKYPVTIIIPWTPEMAKKAAEASRKSQLGIAQQRDKSKEPPKMFAPGEFIFHNLIHQDSFQK